MGYKCKKIELYEKIDESSWSTTSTEITDVFDIDVHLSVGKTKDTFTLRCLNTNGQYKDTFEIDDKIKVYLYKDKVSPENTDLVITGVIRKFPFDESEQRNILTVEGISWSEVFLETLITVVDETNKKFYEIIQTVLNEINNMNMNRRQIYWDVQNNPTKKMDGTTDFPLKNFQQSNLMAAEIVEKLVSHEFTEDGEYLWWIEYNNTDDKYYFKIKARSPTVDDTLEVGVDSINRDKVGFVEEIINAIMVNVGEDCYGVGNYVPAFNPESFGKYGIKWYSGVYQETAGITSALIQSEFEADPSKWDTDSQGHRTENFPLDASYDYTMHFKERDDNGNLTTNDIVVSNDKEFNIAIRNEAEWRGWEEGNKVLDLYSNMRHKVTVDLPQTNSYGLGQLLHTIVSDANLEKNLRIVEIQHTFWTTVLTLEEDEYSVSG